MSTPPSEDSQYQNENMARPVGYRLATRATCCANDMPVANDVGWPKRMDQVMYIRLVVPLDGSEIAEKALTEAEQLSRLTGAPIHLVRVVELTQAMQGAAFGVMIDTDAVATLFNDEITDARQYLDIVCERLRERGLIATMDVLRGPTPSRLVQFAEPGDLFIMASHGRRGLSRWFMGSVAEEVLRRSTVPILLIRPNAYTTAKGQQSGASVTPVTLQTQPV